jgi:hypothetical protein
MHQFADFFKKKHFDLEIVTNCAAHSLAPCVVSISQEGIIGGIELVACRGAC